MYRPSSVPATSSWSSWTLPLATEKTRENKTHATNQIKWSQQTTVYLPPTNSAYFSTSLKKTSL